MAKLMVAGLAVACLTGCAFQASGVEHIGPTNWLAFVQCSADEPAQSIALGEERPITDGWTCMPQKSKGQAGRLLCWTDSSEMVLIARCEDRNYKSAAYFGKCMVWLTCEGE